MLDLREISRDTMKRAGEWMDTVLAYCKRRDGPVHSRFGQIKPVTRVHETLFLSTPLFTHMSSIRKLHIWSIGL